MRCRRLLKFALDRHNSSQAVSHGNSLRLMIMVRTRNILITAALIALPIASQASSVSPVSRAEVRAELVSAELAGQVPFSKVHYPAAQPSAATVYVASKAINNVSYGSSASGETASGKPSLRQQLAANVRPTPVDIYRGR
jgi:hypothetical protein